jgi:hypothetical protein
VVRRNGEGRTEVRAEKAERRGITHGQGVGPDRSARQGANVSAVARIEAHAREGDR